MLTVGIYGIPDTTHGSRPTYTHDHSMAVMCDGKVLDMVALERWTRRKHDNRLDAHIGEFLTQLPADEAIRFVSVNAFVGSAFASQDGNLRIEPTRAVEISAAPVPARVGWWPDGLRARSAEGWALCHEFAHVASLLPFVGRFEPGSLLVHIDGGASDSACSAWYWDGETATLLEASWDLLKTQVNNFNVGPIGRLALGLGAEEHLAMPGKFMGFAGHGAAEPEHIRWLERQGFFLTESDEATQLALRRRFGDAIPWADLAACVQADFEARVAAQIFSWQEQTGARRLYYAGGAALNIPTNAAIEASGRFDAVHIPPCTNDTGLALGAAAWIEFLERGEVAVHDAYLSRADNGPVSLDDVDAIVEALANGQVVGICNGAAEVGPRALGHRSILARPDDVALRQRVSETIKRREPYRPVAPMLLEEVALDAFGPAVAESPLAAFMLGAWRLRPGWEPSFAGVLHADGTLRAQVVRDEPFLCAVLERLWRRHRIAGLINTSFNGPAEPIVHTRADAFACAEALGLNGVVIDGSLHRR